MKNRDHDTAVALKAVAYNIMIISKRTGEMAREIMKIVVR